MQVPLKLPIINPVHVGWLVEFYSYMTLAEGKKYIYSEWRASGITDAGQVDVANLLPIDLFNDLGPLLPSRQETEEFDSVIAVPEA